MNRMKMEYRPISLADQVYERLENDILNGKYTRGEIVTEMQLSSALGVSRTPVREALRRLLQDHLVEESPRGAIVLGVVRKDFEDMCAIRMRIEGMAVRGFIENMTEESIRALREAVDLQEFYLTKSDSVHLRNQDSCFHALIYTHCGSTILCDTLMPLHKKVLRFRNIAIQYSGRAEVSVQEHRAIYNAIEARDADLAESLMIHHIQNALNTIIDGGV
ncbi:MAG: GntR family transcriptional regulator [Christensenellales bacterium]|nr:GntR family transcriptional regulator [Christensenellales bacterium]